MWENVAIFSTKLKREKNHLAINVIAGEEENLLRVPTFLSGIVGIKLLISLKTRAHYPSFQLLH